MQTAETAAGRYSALEPTRSPYLMRAYECAKLTIPALLSQASSGAALPTPFQGLGARGVNNLSSKLLLALLPPSQSCFRLMMDDSIADELAGAPHKRGQIEADLSKMERLVNAEIEASAIRVSVFEAVKQLITTGNVLIYIQPVGGLKVYRLDRYVVKRDPMGAVLEIVVKESVSPAVLPKAFLKTIRDVSNKSPEDSLDLYTHVRRDGDVFRVHQEISGTVVPGTRGFWPLEKSPMLPLRWAKMDGEDYGRGHVEEYLGDLRSLEGLTKAIVEASAAAAKVLFLVNPNGTTEARTIADAPSGAVRSGSKDDVSVLQIEKYNDFRVALETVNTIQHRLSQAFMLVASVARDAERVTAEEIRIMASELEQALGGVYSILSQELQLPLIRRLMHQMTLQGKLPELPPDAVRPSIITGLDALGRGNDLNRLMMFANVVRQLLGDGALIRNADEQAIIRSAGTAVGVDTESLLKSPDVIAAEQAQAQQQAMLQSLAPEVMRGSMEAMNQPQQEPTQ